MSNRCIPVVIMCALIGGCASSTPRERFFGFEVRNASRSEIAVRLFDPTAEYDMTDSQVILGRDGEYRYATTYGDGTTVVVRKWENNDEVGPTLDVPIVENAMVNVVVDEEEGELFLQDIETTLWEW